MQMARKERMKLNGTKRGQKNWLEHKLRGNLLIGIIKRNFMYLSEITFCTIYKAMVRSQLECTVSVWNQSRKEDILRIEKVQMRATKIESSVKLLPNKD